MSGQKFREKMTWQLMLNNNAFAIIVDDENAIPFEIYPVNCYSAEVKYIDNIMHLRFTLTNGNSLKILTSDLSFNKFYDIVINDYLSDLRFYFYCSLTIEFINTSNKKIRIVFNNYTTQELLMRI